MIRANLLEESLIDLFGAIINTSNEQSRAMFFSSLNMKARIDMIRAAIPTGELSEELKKASADILAKALGVIGRRNDLVHSLWKFKGDKLEVSQTTPLKKEKNSQGVIVTEKLLLTLASDYRSAGIEAISIASSIRISRQFPQQPLPEKPPEPQT